MKLRKLRRSLSQALNVPVVFDGDFVTRRKIFLIDAAAHVMQAIETVTANAALHTGDLGGKATTAQVTAAVCELVEKAAVAA